MKGIVDTSIILKAVLDRDIGLRDAPVLSHVALFQVPGYDRLLYVTDAAMNIAPDVEAKNTLSPTPSRSPTPWGTPIPLWPACAPWRRSTPKCPQPWTPPPW